MSEISATPKIGIASYWRLVRGNANFRRLWLAQIVSEMGDWFYSLAIYSLLLEMTGRASSVALALMLQVWPQTLINPTAGVVNDHMRRKVVMIVADVARFVIVLAMLLVRSPGMVWLVYPLLVLETLMWGFFEPARSSVIPNVCRQEEIILANTLSSTTWSLNLAIGASLGGVVAALLGRDAVFVINALSFLLSAILILRMKFAEPHTEHKQLRARDLVDYGPVLEGVRYVRSDGRRTAMLLVKAGLFVMGPSWVLYTVMGKHFPVHLRGLTGERSAILGMSFLMASRGVGALLGPLLSAPWAGQKEKRLRFGILAGFATAGVGYTLLSFADNIWLACASVALAHTGGSVVWVFSTTLLQMNIDDKFRGRVFAAELGLAMFVLGVGAYLAGFFMDAGVSPSRVALATGAIMLVPFLVWARAQRLWAEESGRQAEAEVA